VKKEHTVHTSRTIMFSELGRIMSYVANRNSLENAFNDNVIGKLSKSNQEKTNRYLKQLYGFDLGEPFFASFTWFWKRVPENEHAVITLLLAIKNDFLLAESIDVVMNMPIGGKVTIEILENNIQKQHPNRYSTVTLHSVARNIVSSWKQAGFILGKVKNIRTQPNIGFGTVPFALLLGYLCGMRGDFLLSSKYIRALGLTESRLRDLISEAAKRDLLQYQYSGHVTTILFPKQD